MDELEILWIQVLLFQQPTYQNNICDNIDLALDERRDLFETGEYNIDWKSVQSDGKKTKFSKYMESRN